jgi:hypothetical protein
MLQPDALAPALYTALVVTLTAASEARLEQVVAGQSPETAGQPILIRTYPPFHGG